MVSYYAPSYLHWLAALMLNIWLVWSIVAIVAGNLFALCGILLPTILFALPLAALMLRGSEVAQAAISTFE